MQAGACVLDFVTARATCSVVPTVVTQQLNWSLLLDLRCLWKSRIDAEGDAGFSLAYRPLCYPDDVSDLEMFSSDKTVVRHKNLDCWRGTGASCGWRMDVSIVYAEGRKDKIKTDSRVLMRRCQYLAPSCSKVNCVRKCLTCSRSCARRAYHSPFWVTFHVGLLTNRQFLNCI